jgi:FAD/FMN-containing dehydrogenase
MSRRARWIVGTLLLAIALPLSRPAIHLGKTAWRDRRSDLAIETGGKIDDASHMNATSVSAVIDISADDATALAQIRHAYEMARVHGGGVSVAGARHSMGGQSIAPRGVVLNMLRHDHVRYDRRTQGITVGSGATWDLIIPYLDHFGRAVDVMQSDSPFSVGGSISVNCHGWQARKPPISSTVVAFNLVTPDGRLLHCSRTENRDLFEHVLGGYGLFGVVLDVELRTVANERYERHSHEFRTEEYDAQFTRIVERNEGSTPLAYGRLSITPEHFLTEAILTTFTRAEGEPEPLRWHESSRMERLLFSGSLRSDYGKGLRWWAEENVAPLFYARYQTRNEIMDGDTAVYLNRSAAERDVLHEYFIPRRHFASFIRDVQRIVPRHRLELLNVTIRDVRRDDETMMSYAREDVFAVVLFFSQRPDAAEENAMREATREMIDSALRHDGTYYLPYRLHATPAQFRSAYPKCGAFFAMKAKIDPSRLLQNRWFQTYAEACR